MKILDDCIACGACLPECPTESISEGDGILYVIDQQTCVECEDTLIHRNVSASARWTASSKHNCSKLV